MFITEDLLFVVAVVFGFYFTEGAIDFPIFAHSGPKIPAGDMYAHVRGIVYPLFGMGAWYICASFAESANNCYWAFNACYTSPTFLSTTATVFGDPAGDILFWFFWALFFLCGAYFVGGIYSMLGKAMAETAAPLGLREP